MIEITNKPEIWDIYQTEDRSGYESKSGKNDPTFYLIKKLIKQGILKQDEILEIGFGDGKTLQLLALEFKKVYGADISPKNIEVTRKEFKNLNINNADFFVLDLINPVSTDKQYNIILLNHVLEHFTLDELNLIIPNLLKLLKPKGKLIGAVPFNLPFTYRVCPHCQTKFEIDGHRIKYDADIFRKNFLHFGFREIIIRSYNPEFYSKNDNVVKKSLRLLYYRFVKKPKGQLEFCLEKDV